MLDLYVLRLQTFNISWSFYLLGPSAFCNLTIQWLTKTEKFVSHEFLKAPLHFYQRLITKRSYKKYYFKSWENEYLNFIIGAQSLKCELCHELPHTLSLLWNRPEEQKNSCCFASLCKTCHPQISKCSMESICDGTCGVLLWRYTLSHNTVMSLPGPKERHRTWH